ncbi:MAG TPA: hypothetical protein VIL44_09470 [Micromonospora sp.]
MPDELSEALDQLGDTSGWDRPGHALEVGQLGTEDVGDGATIGVVVDGGTGTGSLRR